MKKRFLAVVAMAAMLVAMMPSMVFGATSLPAPVNGVITLTEDVQLDGKLAFSEDTIVNLNGKTLTLKATDNYVTGENSVTFMNGKISLEPTSGAGNGIICVGKYNTGTKGTLTFDNVDVVGKNISSGAGTIFLSKNSTLEVINGSEISVENEGSSAAYVIYCNDGLTNTVNIEDSKVSVANGNSGLYSGKITVKNSELDLNVRDNGINTLENGLELTVDNSDVNVAAENGRAVTLYGTSTAEFINNSKVDLSSDGEATIRYKSGTTGKISLDGTTTMNIIGDKPLVIDEKAGEAVTEETFKEYMELPDTVEFSGDGSIVIDGGAPDEPSDDPTDDPTTPDDPADDPSDSDKGETPDTGDNMNTAIPFAAAGIALAAMAAVVVTRRRDN